MEEGERGGGRREERRKGDGRGGGYLIEIGRSAHIQPEPES